jgi:hypothetical protein
MQYDRIGGEPLARAPANRELHEQDLAVRQLDPLRADAFFASALPQINAAADVPRLVQALPALLPSDEECAAFDRLAALAATRDLGILAASLATHTGGIAAAPRLAAALLKLSAITAEVPRDTLYTYAPRNPSDGRMRMFLNIPEERLFIRSVADSIEGFPQCIQTLEVASAGAELGEDCAARLRQAAAQLQRMVASILEVRQGVSPEVFSFRLRPFFPLFEVGGRTYAAPSGPQLPLIIVDILLFGAEQAWSDTAPAYATYVADNLAYLPPALRQVAAQARGRPSLVGRLCRELPQALAAQPSARPQMLALVEATLQLLAVLLKFRWPHKRVAEANMRVRPPDAQGSSGYTVEVLEVLLEKTLEAHSRVKRLHDLLQGEP